MILLLTDARASKHSRPSSRTSPSRRTSSSPASQVASCARRETGARSCCTPLRAYPPVEACGSFRQRTRRTPSTAPGNTSNPPNRREQAPPPKERGKSCTERRFRSWKISRKEKLDRALACAVPCPVDSGDRNATKRQPAKSTQKTTENQKPSQRTFPVHSQGRFTLSKKGVEKRCAQLAQRGCHAAKEPIRTPRIATRHVSAGSCQKCLQRGDYRGACALA